MKIDICLTATNTKSNYIKHIPTFVNSWLRLQIEPMIILINNEIPDEYTKYKDYIILFDPAEYNLQHINTGYIAQIIRIFYPPLLTSKNVIISDIDIVPINYKFFVKYVDEYPEDVFVNYRRYNGQLNICYNLANSLVWGEVFEIDTIMDVVREIEQNYSANYDGQKNCDGWFRDQEVLTNNVLSNISEDRIIYIDIRHKLKRIDKRERATILKNIEQILENIEQYDDFHITSKNGTYINLSDRIINKILTLPI
jgi:hypothetical protein